MTTFNCPCGCTITDTERRAEFIADRERVEFWTKLAAE